MIPPHSPKRRGVRVLRTQLVPIVLVVGTPEMGTITVFVVGETIVVDASIVVGTTAFAVGNIPVSQDTVQ